MNNNERFSCKITRVSFGLAVCVVFIHANNTITYQFNMASTVERLIYIFENWAQGWQQCAVPLFFVISGFLFYRNYSPDKLISKWKSRCQTLLIPYLIWTNIPWLLLSIVKLTPLGKYIHTDATFTIRSWLEFVIQCKGTVLWYVRSTIVFVLLTPIIFTVMKSKWMGIIFIVSIMFINTLMISMGIKVVEEQYWCIPYLVGAWIAIWRPDFFVKRAKRKNVIVACTVFIFLLTIAINYEITLFHPVTQFLYKMSLPLPLWFALDIFEFERKPRWFEKMSFPLYCTHAIILETIEKVIYIAWGNCITVAFASYIFTPILVILILLLIFHNISRYFPHIYRLAFGSRG